MSQEELPADASTLIYLAKADAFDEAAACVSRILVPPSVWREAVDEGERIGALEVPRIRAAAEAGVLARVDPSEAELARASALAAQYRLGAGESEVLALAMPARRAIVDEGRAARVAQSLGIVPVSTLFLPVLGRRAGTLDARTAIAMLRKLAGVIGARAEAVFAIEQELRKESG
jgi:predicted nucleic acid-binding protein